MTEFKAIMNYMCNNNLK